MVTPVVHARMQHQAHRIEAGEASGQLTRSESAQLRAEQRELRQTLHEARADGTVSPEERRELRALQNQASRDIYELKHNDARVAPGETPRVDRRQENQAARIERGVEDGSLTARETARLQAMERRIEGAEARAKQDGVVSPAERQRLDALQDLASSAIWLARHNAARRP